VATLTDKQEMFCREYIIDLNATQAAIRAGYSEKTAREQASRLLSNINIETRLSQLKKQRSNVVKVDAEYVLKRHHEIDCMDVADIMNDDFTIKPLSEWPKCWRQTLNGIDVAEITSGEDGSIGVLKKIKWPDKLRNLELLGKHVDVSAYSKDDADGNSNDKLVEAVASLIDKLPN